MPRFYFHVVDGTSIAQDDEGVCLPNLAAARRTAMTGARDIMASELHRGSIDLSWRIEVTDQAGETVLTVPFADAVRVTGLPH